MAEIIGKKSCVLDVRAKLPSGAYVNVEVQIRDHRNMDRRSLYYLSKEYTRRLKKGEDYVLLPNVIAINIVNFNYPGTKNFHSCFHLREDTEHEIILTDALEVHFINMVKYRKQCKEKPDLNDPLVRWLAWFDRNSPQELRKEVIEMDTAIKTAEDRFDELLQDEDAYDAWFRHRLAEYDRACERNYFNNEIADIKAKFAEKDAELACVKAENERIRAELEAYRSN